MPERDLSLPVIEIEDTDNGNTEDFKADIYIVSYLNIVVLLNLWLGKK